LVCGLEAPAHKKTGAQGAGFFKPERRITSSRLSFLPQVLQERLGLQALPQQQVLRGRLVRDQRLVLVQQRVLVQVLLLSCHRQQVPKRAARRRGFAWS